MISTAFLKCLCHTFKLALRSSALSTLQDAFPPELFGRLKTNEGFVWGDVKALPNSGVDQTSKLWSARFASAENPGAVPLMYKSKLETDMNQR